MPTPVRIKNSFISIGCDFRYGWAGRKTAKKMTLFLKMKKAAQQLEPLVLFATVALLILIQIPLGWISEKISFSLAIILLEWGLLFGGALLWGGRSAFPLHSLFLFRSPTGKQLIYIAIMTISLAILIDHLLFLTDQIFPPSPEVREAMNSLMQVKGWQAILWQGFLICLTPAICEEFFFRGLLQQGLSLNRWPSQRVMLATAFAFAVMHGVPHYWHLYFVMGLFLCWLMQMTGNLSIPIAAHFINNGWTFANHLAGNEVTTWNGNAALLFCAAAVIFVTAVKRFRSLTT